MKKIIVNGVFDVLHPGHLHLLNFARAQGDFLLVAIDSDAKVKERKGTNRPFFNQQERAEMLINLRCVNEVVVFSTEEELAEIIKECDLMVKGSDHQFTANYNIPMIYYPRDNNSTTKILHENIIDRL